MTLALQSFGEIVSFSQNCMQCTSAGSAALTICVAKSPLLNVLILGNGVPRLLVRCVRMHAAPALDMSVQRALSLTHLRLGSDAGFAFKQHAS